MRASEVLDILNNLVADNGDNGTAPVYLIMPNTAQLEAVRVIGANTSYLDSNISDNNKYQYIVVGQEIGTATPQLTVNDVIAIVTALVAGTFATIEMVVKMDKPCLTTVQGVNINLVTNQALATTRICVLNCCCSLNINSVS